MVGICITILIVLATVGFFPFFGPFLLHFIVY